MTYADTRENRARIAKVNAMLVLLIQFRFTVADLESMDNDEWKRLAIAAQVKEPGPESRRMVIDKLGEAERMSKEEFHRRLMDIEKKTRPAEEKPKSRKKAKR